MEGLKMWLVRVPDNLKGISITEINNTEGIWLREDQDSPVFQSPRRCHVWRFTRPAQGGLAAIVQGDRKQAEKARESLRATVEDFFFRKAVA